MKVLKILEENDIHRLRVALGNLRYIKEDLENGNQISITRIMDVADIVQSTLESWGVTIPPRK